MIVAVIVLLTASPAFAQEPTAETTDVELAAFASAGVSTHQSMQAGGIEAFGWLPFGGGAGARAGAFRAAPMFGDGRSADGWTWEVLAAMRLGSPRAFFAIVLGLGGASVNQRATNDLYWIASLELGIRFQRGPVIFGFSTRIHHIVAPLWMAGVTAFIGAHF